MGASYDTTKVERLIKKIFITFKRKETKKEHQESLSQPMNRFDRFLA